MRGRKAGVTGLLLVLTLTRGCFGCEPPEGGYLDNVALFVDGAGAVYIAGEYMAHTGYSPRDDGPRCLRVDDSGVSAIAVRAFTPGWAITGATPLLVDEGGRFVFVARTTDGVRIDWSDAAAWPFVEVARGDSAPPVDPVAPLTPVDRAWVTPDGTIRVLQGTSEGTGWLFEFADRRHLRTVPVALPDGYRLTDLVAAPHQAVADLPALLRDADGFVGAHLDCATDSCQWAPDPALRLEIPDPTKVLVRVGATAGGSLIAAAPHFSGPTGADPTGADPTGADPARAGLDDTLDVSWPGGAQSFPHRSAVQGDYGVATRPDEGAVVWRYRAGEADVAIDLHVFDEAGASRTFEVPLGERGSYLEELVAVVVVRDAATGAEQARVFLLEEEEMRDWRVDLTTGEAALHEWVLEDLASDTRGARSAAP